MTHPKWLPVPGYYADVLSNAYELRNSITLKPYVLSLANGGYWQTQAKCIDTNNMKTLSMHRAIALTCIPNPDNKPQVNHIDGIKTNNLPWNLEWVTPSGNIQHAFRTKLRTPLKGEEIKTSKYKEDQIRTVCELLRDRPDLTLEKIGKLAGVSRNCVKDVYNRNEWKHISKDYTFQPRDSMPKGEDNKKAIYNRDDIERLCCALDDKYLGKTDYTLQQISDSLSINHTVVSHVWNGESWEFVSRNHRFYQDKYGKEGNVA